MSRLTRNDCKAVASSLHPYVFSSARYIQLGFNHPAISKTEAGSDVGKCIVLERINHIEGCWPVCHVVVMTSSYRQDIECLSWRKNRPLMLCVVQGLYDGPLALFGRRLFKRRPTGKVG